jgi:hypothetical protein
VPFSTRPDRGVFEPALMVNRTFGSGSSVPGHAAVMDATSPDRCPLATSERGMRREFSLLRGTGIDQRLLSNGARKYAPHLATTEASHTGRTRRNVLRIRDARLPATKRQYGGSRRAQLRVGGRFSVHPASRLGEFSGRGRTRRAARAVRRRHRMRAGRCPRRRQRMSRVRRCARMAATIRPRPKGAR